MDKLREKLIQAYSVLYYYHLVDNTKGLKLEEIPEDIRTEVEIKANERFMEEYQKGAGENNGL